MEIILQESASFTFTRGIIHQCQVMTNILYMDSIPSLWLPDPLARNSTHSKIKASTFQSKIKKPLLNTRIFLPGLAGGQRTRWWSNGIQWERTFSLRRKRQEMVFSQTRSPLKCPNKSEYFLNMPSLYRELRVGRRGSVVVRYRRRLL